MLKLLCTVVTALGFLKRKTAEGDGLCQLAKNAVSVNVHRDLTNGEENFNNVTRQLPCDIK
jgi:hypothetical protein